MPLSIHASASNASRSSVAWRVGAPSCAAGRAGAWCANVLAEEDRALLCVGEPDTDDFDDAMALRICHKIDRRARYKIGARDVPPDQR